MARKLRLQYEGAIYHLMSRGDRGEAIFRDDLDRRMFLKTLAEACEKTDWQVHAWLLRDQGSETRRPARIVKRIEPGRASRTSEASPAGVRSPGQALTVWSPGCLLFPLWPAVIT